MEAALQLTREGGPGAVTARDIAARLNVSTRPIFTYFKTMDELKGEISGLAVEIASKVAEKEIGEQEHEALIEKFIDELGEGS